MKNVLGWLLAIAGIVCVALTTFWVVLAVWYRLPASDAVKLLTCALIALYGIVTLTLLLTRWRLRSAVMYCSYFVLVLVWWISIKPPAIADWSPDVSRQVTGDVNGDTLILDNVRNFYWRSDDDFTEQWVKRTYDLNKLKTTDLFLSYWAGPEMAHVIISFGFEDEKYLAWSVEVRRKKGGEFSPIADMFKTSPLVIVAADERDVIGVRTNVRGEDVQLYRLRTSPENARRMLMGYVERANALAKRPEFYNSITTNCSTTIVQIARAVGSRIPFDWRLLVNGYLPEYVYEKGSVNIKYPLEELRKLSRISSRALEIGLTDQYSQNIRTEVPAAFD